MKRPTQTSDRDRREAVQSKRRQVLADRVGVRVQTFPEQRDYLCLGDLRAIRDSPPLRDGPRRDFTCPREVRKCVKASPPAPGADGYGQNALKLSVRQCFPETVELILNDHAKNLLPEPRRDRADLDRLIA
jgi:hypothetical protein